MLVSTVLERTQAVCAWQLCADKLADWVRSSWQEHTDKGIKAWEDAAIEDAGALPGLRNEGFTDLVGLDYIFKWWGGSSHEDLGGVLDVIWKTLDENNDAVVCYKTWIKLADRDFSLGIYKSEDAKREANRAAFRDAFAQWKTLFENKSV